jgi:hypothetical protein
MLLILSVILPGGEEDVLRTGLGVVQKRKMSAAFMELSPAMLTIVGHGD